MKRAWNTPFTDCLWRTMVFGGSSRLTKDASLILLDLVFYFAEIWHTCTAKEKKKCMRRWRKIVRTDFEWRRFNCKKRSTIARFYLTCTRACAEIPRTRQNNLVGRIYDPTGSCLFVFKTMVKLVYIAIKVFPQMLQIEPSYHSKAEKICFLVA